jgi:uncharacterized membrane protein
MHGIFSLLPQAASAFLASMVEFVEALTVVLAVGSVRGWRPALQGTAVGLAILFAAVAIMGPVLTLVPLAWLKVGIGLLLFAFGFRWLKKAVLRAAGIIPLHDEAKLYAKSTDQLHFAGKPGRHDWIAISTACNIVLVEGAEVVFIVLAIGSASGGWLVPGAGALAALLAVILLGVLLHKPLTKVPENAMKMTVGIFLSAFGLYWAGEGAGLDWPGDEWSLVGLILAFALGAYLAVTIRRPAPERR